MIESPFFSVVIPTFNRAEFLREAIQSVLNQTFENYEVIVVDDHSTDNTKEVAAAFKDKRINYVPNDRGIGGAGTRNTGIFRARGEWVAFLDDDDVWLPQKLQLQFNKIKEVNDTVGLIYGGYATYDFDRKQEISVRVPEKEGWIQQELLYKNYIGTYSTVVIQSNLLKMVSGLDERFKGMQDMELYVRIAGISKIMFVKEKLAYIRNSNSDRISFNVENKLECSHLFWEKYKGQINRNPKLRHRAASRVFIYAVAQGNMIETFKALPWTLSGLLFDFSNFVWTFRSIPSLIYNKKIKKIL